MKEQVHATERFSERNRVRVQIDHELCVGFGDCVDAAPSVFVLNEDNLAVLTDLDSVDLAALVAAADACPVSAVLVFTDGDVVLAPADRRNT